MEEIHVDLATKKFKDFILSCFPLPRHSPVPQLREDDGGCFPDSLYSYGLDVNEFANAV